MADLVVSLMPEIAENISRLVPVYMLLLIAAEMSSSGRNAAGNLSVSSQGLVGSLHPTLIKSQDRRVWAQEAAQGFCETRYINQQREGSNARPLK